MMRGWEAVCLEGAVSVRRTRYAGRKCDWYAVDQVRIGRHPLIFVFEQ